MSHPVAAVEADPSGKIPASTPVLSPVGVPGSAVPGDGRRPLPEPEEDVRLRKKAKRGARPPRYRIASLHDALLVLESFLDVPDRADGVSRISERLGMTKNKVFRILATLAERGYVERDDATETYRLGLTLFKLGSAVHRGADVTTHAQPILMRLAHQTGEVAHLVMRQNDQAVCVAHHGSDRMLQAFDQVGAPIPLYTGASPKLLLAYAPVEEREQLIRASEFRAFTPNTISDVGRLRRQLEQILAQGFATDIEGFEVGVCAIGAPVFDARGRVIAGLTITAPKSRFNAKAQKLLLKSLLEAAAELSQMLGHHPDGHRPRALA